MRLWQLLWEQRLWLALGVLGIVAHTGGTLLVFLLTEPFINALRGEAGPESASAFTRWLFTVFPALQVEIGPDTAGAGILVNAMERVIGLLVMAIAVMAGGQGLQNWGINAAVQRVLRKLREDVFRQTMRLSLNYFEREQTGGILAHLTLDTAALRDYLTNALGHFLALPILIVGTFALMVGKSWQLTALSLLVLPLLALLFWMVGRKVRQAGQRSLQSLGELSTTLTETVVGMPVVKAFTREEAGLQAFSLQNRNAFKAEMTKIRARSLLVALSTIIVTGAIGWLLLEGLRLVERGTLPGGPGALVAFMLLLYKFSESLQKAGGYWTGYQEMLAAAERIFRFLSQEPAVRDLPGAAELILRGGEVQFEEVRFRYNGDGPLALDGVSFTVPSGQTIALVGPSGSGKTSIAKLLLRLYDPQEGRILVDGQDIRQVTQRSLRARMAFVPQGTLLFSGTIASNIRFGNEQATTAQVEEAARQANAHEFIRQLEQGYQTPVGERGITLSGGQAQRIAIARALLRDPVILILDEATSALDTQSEQVVQEALTRLMRGRTTLVIAHRLSTIQDADEILVLDRGQIVQRGRHESLLASEGMYRELYQHALLT